MTAHGRLHPDEIEVDSALVERLLAAQFPQWSTLPVERFPSTGTSNWIYRLGTDLTVRLPRRPSSSASLESEFAWLPRLAPRLPVPIPVALAVGVPSEAFPHPWAVYRWLEGDSGSIATTASATEVARDLARFIAALQRIEPADGPAPGPHNSFRGAPLATRDARTRACIAELEGLIDAPAVTAAWNASIVAPPWQGEPTWLHGDLLPANLLLADGRLAAVIDFGSLGVGDPACDLMAAWATFGADARTAFRGELPHVDGPTWARARGWALSWALIAMPYYLHTNPEFIATARHTIAEVLADALANPE